MTTTSQLVTRPMFIAVVASLLLAVGLSSPVGALELGPRVYPNHWGPNPYLHVTPSHPYYRSIAVIDNTGSPPTSRWIQAMVSSVNALHNSYNANYPVLLYYQNIFFRPFPNLPELPVNASGPCSAGPTQYLVLCHDPSQAPALYGRILGTATNGHLDNLVVRFSTPVFTMCEGGLFSLVVKEMGNALGLDLNQDPGSALYAGRDPASSCQTAGFTLTDLNGLNDIYNHAS